MIQYETENSTKNVARMGLETISIWGEKYVVQNSMITKNDQKKFTTIQDFFVRHTKFKLPKSSAITEIWRVPDKNILSLMQVSLRSLQSGKYCNFNYKYNITESVT